MATAGYLKELLSNGEVRKTQFNGPETKIIESFSDAARPSALLYPQGFGIWNTSDNAYNYSDGAGNWRDAMGAIT